MKISRKVSLAIAICMIACMMFGVTANARDVKMATNANALTMSSSQSHSVGMLNAVFDQDSLTAESNWDSFTISNLPSNARISRIVVNSQKSNGSAGTVRVYMAKEEDNGDGTFDMYTDDKLWGSSLNYTDFGLYNLSANGTYWVYFKSTRYSVGDLAAATLKNVRVTVYYTY